MLATSCLASVLESDITRAEMSMMGMIDSTDEDSAASAPTATTPTSMAEDRVRMVGDDNVLFRIAGSAVLSLTLAAVASCYRSLI